MNKLLSESQALDEAQMFVSRLKVGAVPLQVLDWSMPLNVLYGS